MPKRNYTIPDMDAFVEERLSDYLDGQLSSEERALVEAHLQKSERARASLESLRWTVNLIKQTPAPALPPVAPPVPAAAQPLQVALAPSPMATFATLQESSGAPAPTAAPFMITL